jgi:hypothetical protein
MEERFERVGATMLSTLSALMHALPDSVNARMLTQQTLTEEVDAKVSIPWPPTFPFTPCSGHIKVHQLDPPRMEGS